MDIDTQECDLNKLEWHFIELKKFHKNIDDLGTILDKWIYFFKYAITLREIPDTLSDPALLEAFSVLEQYKWSTEELEAYDRYMDAARCYTSQYLQQRKWD